MRPENAINLVDYPLDKLTSTIGNALIVSCREQLAESGSCLLPDFIDSRAVQLALKESLDQLDQAHQVDHEFSYDDVDDQTLAVSPDSLPVDHPRHHKSLTKIRFLARDLLPPSNPLRVIHGWPQLAEFIGSVIGKVIFPSACPLSSCVVTVAEEGELQDWHFDGADFIVTIMLEEPSSGGNFEYVTDLRSSYGIDDFDGISKVFNGDRQRVQVPNIAPGTLTLFKGRFNLHRAAPVDPGSRRVMAVLSFETEPNKTGSAAFLKLFYGRSLGDLPVAERLVQFS